MPVTIWVIIAALAAAGVILVAGYLTVSLIKKKLKEKYSDFWKAKIKDKYQTFGVPVVEVEVEDLYGNTIGENKFASLDGCSSNINKGDVLYS